MDQHRVYLRKIISSDQNLFAGANFGPVLLVQENHVSEENSPSAEEANGGEVYNPPDNGELLTVETEVVDEVQDHLQMVVQSNVKIEEVPKKSYASIVSDSYSGSVDGDIIEDDGWLFVIFGHVEKLLTLAASLRFNLASLHFNFLQARSLTEEIFSDYHDYCQQNMGSGSMQGDSKKHVVFTPPTANQSWSNVLSMGNLLNGHEPTLREITFSKRDQKYCTASAS
ncbi:Rab3 GTPase-activating protein catalytic subunit [Forsythia ovata]|uniref:Rab3 GTPase-activating protein catalytic subunit n=1 Tax=Forsythia ovata TaxID=205694 RepID=A0ABD1X4X3_9LAMI